MRKASRILAPLLATLMLSHCAQTAPPLPPSLELPKPVSDLRAKRKGDKVYLHWTIPTRTVDGESIRSLGPTKICRSLEANSKCESPAAETPAAGIPEAPKKNKVTKPPERAEAGYVDTIPANLLQAGATNVLHYAVVVPNADGRSAGISNQVEIPAAITLPPPSDFRARVTADGVVLSWAPPATQPPAGTSFVYRVYRNESGEKNDALVGEVPFGEGSNEIVDHGFEWQKTYAYHATIATEVSLGMHPCKEGTAPSMDCASVSFVEGEDTPVVLVAANDVFPPAVPSGLQAVFSGPGQQPFIDLIWAPDVEPDLAGYNIYRREGDGQALKINGEPVKTPAYRDAKVEAGKTYGYTVSAVDLRANESGRSEEATERVP